ncbi:MAG: hypothetical protein WA609_08615 [Terriglobales bacterium]
MLLLAKIGLGISGALAVAAGYTFHEGMVRVSVDEHGANGDHVHLVVPAALIPVAMRFAPRHRMEDALRKARPWLPAVQSVAKELRKFPDAELVEVRDAEEHVVIHTQDGKLLVDVESRDETVHVACPLVTIEHISEEISDSSASQRPITD